MASGGTELDAAAEESRQRRAAAGANPAIVAVAARPGDAAGRGVYRGDPVAADIVRQWGDTAELPPAFDDDGLLTAATFAPPADAVAAVPAASPDIRHRTARRAPWWNRSRARSGGAWTLRRRWQQSPGSGGPRATRSTRPANVAAAVGRALAEAGVDRDAVDDIAVVEHDAATVTLAARALGIDGERINRSGGAVATGNAGAAEELRLITDGLAVTGRLLLTVSAGPTGSAAIVWQTDI